jgi:hypothetical protein
MALVISAVQVTGTATAYTVPADKVAKVRIVNIDTLAYVKTLTIGNYEARNSTSSSVSTKKQGNSSPGTNIVLAPVYGFVRASNNGSSMGDRYLYVKEDHVLVAGETVSCDDAGCTMSYTIFEEDV